ncbi:hypothetical protein ACIPEN_14300 [Herbaspirillum chlorophenolicum]|uniref:Uncharacterized protein n=1 Tax=Herbaspirillum chlorophenolicum TaxID=211589 RepID=A0ABW8F131_9BURK
MRKVLLAVACATLCATTSINAADFSTPGDIEKVLRRIPVTDKDFGYKHIGERLPKFDMAAEHARVEKVTKADAEPPYFLAGDEVITLTLSRPNAVAQQICPITGGLTVFVIRGKKVIPQSRTGYWLMTNRCDFKG